MSYELFKLTPPLQKHYKALESMISTGKGDYMTEHNATLDCIGKSITDGAVMTEICFALNKLLLRWNAVSSGGTYTETDKFAFLN